MISIVGIGMDGKNTITYEAKKAITEADMLIGAKRMLTPFAELGIPSVEEYHTDRIVAAINENKEKKIAVLMSGDCGFYSGAAKLREALKDCDVSVISGISSPLYFCSKAGLDWSDMNFLSLHGASANIVRNVSSHRKNFFLMGGDITPVELCRRLADYGLGDVRIWIGSELSYENENIVSGTASEIARSGMKFGRLVSLIAVNEDYERFVRASIPDEEFIRGKVPMTKAEVRGIIVNGLDIGRESICWDIGSGTGSVAVEMALRCTDGRVFAIDCNEEACGLIRSNSVKFRCDNIAVVHGEASDEVMNFPAPDSVFIGGSKGKMVEIIECAIRKNPSVKLTVSAVSLETLQQAKAIFDEVGIDCDITQIAVTRIRKIGTHTMLAAENPIFIIRRKNT